MPCQTIRYGQIWNNLPLRLKALLMFLIAVPALVITGFFLASAGRAELDSRVQLTAYARQNLPLAQARVVEVMTARAGETRSRYVAAVAAGAVSCGLSLLVAMLVFAGGLSTQLRVLSSSARGLSRPKELTLENWELNVLSRAIETADVPRQPGTRRMASAYGDESWPSVSHDFRIQLTGIMGFSELLLDGDFGALSAGQKECLDDILSSAKAVLDIVQRRDLVSFEAPEVIGEPALVPAARENSCAGLLIVPGKARSGNPTESLLKSAGYSVQTAATESEVRLRCENQLFDVIVFDLEPSRAGSLQMLRVIRESGLNARTPVIGLSLAGSTGDAANDRTGGSVERLQQIAACLRRLTSKAPLSITATALGNTTHGS